MESIIENKYKILEKIGAGGTSVVYKAQKLDDESIVAIKVLKDEHADNIRQVERFTRESRTLNELSHPNIVNILDVGKMQDGKDYIVMEYISGMTLKQYIKESGHLQFDRIVELAVQMCDALGYAHQNNVIHRDIKPQNILLDKNGNARIADFGTARVVDQNTLTMAGRDVIGSVHYIAPEQVKGGVIDARSDIYSLGITIFEMATGALPFTGDDAITIAMSHINQSPKRPKDINMDIPKCLNDIILKCISKDPLKRYQTTDELRGDLLSAQENPDAFNVFAPKINVLPIEEEEETVSNNSNNKYKRSSARKTNNKRKKKKEQFAKNVLILILLILILIGGAFFVLINTVFNNTEQDIEDVKQEIVIQNMVGKTFDEAVQWAKSVGLRTPGQPAKYTVSEVVPEGQVMGQSLKEGETVYKEDHPSISFEVSCGPERVRIPRLIGMKVEDAREALEELGLELGDITEVNTIEYQSLRIFYQSIDEGTTVYKGTKVNISIAKSSGLEKIVPNLVSMTREEAEIALKDSKFQLGEVIFEASDRPVNTIISQEPAADTPFPYDDNVSVKIFISSGTEVTYYGKIKIDIPPIMPITDVSIRYVDENGEEVVFASWVVNDDSYTQGGVWEHNHYDPFSFEAVKYRLYINNELNGEYYMLFYDGNGNLLSEIPTEGDSNGE